MKDGDDEVDPASTSEALIGGEEPRGDGFGGELLELRCDSVSLDGNGLIVEGCTLPYPFDCGCNRTGEFEMTDEGSEMRGFFAGDFAVVDAGVLFGFWFKRMPSASISETVPEEGLEAGILRRG
jgi:hypothetical protein